MRVWSRATYVDLLELISLVVGSPQASKKLVRMLHLFVNYKWQRSCHLIVNTLLHVNYRFLIVCFAHYQNQQNNSLHTYFGLKAQNSSNKLQQSCSLLLECTPKKASPKVLELCCICTSSFSIIKSFCLLCPQGRAGRRGFYVGD